MFYLDMLIKKDYGTEIFEKKNLTEFLLMEIILDQCIMDESIPKVSNLKNLV